MAFLTASAMVGIALVLGGWEWAIVAAAGLAFSAAAPVAPRSIALIALVGLAWLILFQLTGDRRLFFPYSMQYAVQAACLLKGRHQWATVMGGGALVCVFTLIRIGQDATPRVLAVELIVAAIVLGAAAALYDRIGSRAGAAALASMLAFTGLAL